jgi:hypothetical protein
MGRRSDMLSRRDLVGKIAAGAAAVCASGALARVAFGSTGRTRGNSAAGESSNSTGPVGAQSLPVGAQSVVDAEPPATLSAPVPWDILRPLGVGSPVAHGWRVASLTGAVDGSCVLTLQNERGRLHRIHICRNDGHPQGLVYTDQFDLVAMNGGQGDLPTEEGLAQAVAEVAHVLARNGRRAPEIVTALLSQAERVRRFSGPDDRRLR